MSRSRRTSWWLGGVGLLLAFALLLKAEPAEVLALAGRARWSGLLAALAGTALLALLRGARLSLLAGGELRLKPSTAVAAVAQLATGVLPLRLGELAMIPLLQAAGLPGAIRGLSVLVLVRVLDLLAVLLWATAGGALIGGSPEFAGAMLVSMAVVLAAAWVAGMRVIRRLVGRWRRAPGWRRKALRQLLRVRREVVHLARSPARTCAAVLLSVLLWAVIWAVTVVLLRAMALTWPPSRVLLGVLGAAIGSSLPISSVGSFGTQEAGWAAALAGLGVAPQAALAAGFACHLWSLAFTFVVGGAGLVYLASCPPAPSSTPLRTRLSSFFRSDRRA
ncbi:MAG: lysylphosphatidylglycerol synthase domain-containing protein [Thermoanaerobaculaceae bacterium]